MGARVALVVTSTTAEPGELLAARLRHLLESGWDARLLYRGAEWQRDPALHDPSLADRVELVSTAGPLLVRARLSTARRRHRGHGLEPSPFAARLLALRPDLLHFHSGSAARRWMWLKDLLGCRLVVTLREDGRLAEILAAREVAPSADLLLLSSAAVRDRARDRGLPVERCEVLEAPPPPAPGPAGRRRPGPLRVLSAGPVIWEHGLEHSVHAIRVLRDRGVDCRYRVVGDGDHLAAVAFARHQLGVEDQVELVSPDGPAGLTRELASADVFLDPSVIESTPKSPLAAAHAAGLPCVVTRPWDGYGVGIPRRDPGAIADALARLATEGFARRAPGGGELPVATLEQHLRRLEALYRRVLA